MSRALLPRRFSLAIPAFAICGLRAAYRAIFEGGQGGALLERAGAARSEHADNELVQELTGFLRHVDVFSKPPVGHLAATDEGHESVVID